MLKWYRMFLSNNVLERTKIKAMKQNYLKIVKKIKARQINKLARENNRPFYNPVEFSKFSVHM